MKSKNHWQRDGVKLYQCAYCLRQFVWEELADGVPNANICMGCADKYYEALEVEEELRKMREEQGKKDEG